MCTHTICLIHCTQNGFSPLYLASQEGNTEVVDALLNSGADPSLASEVWRPVDVFLCATTGSYSTWVYMYVHLAELTTHITHNTGWKTGACREMSFVHLSIQNTCSVPLSVAAEKGHARTVERLLKEKVNINYQDEVKAQDYREHV